MKEISMRMLRLPDVMSVTGLSRAAIYSKGNPNDAARYDPDFPPRVQLSKNAVAWPSDGLQAWLDKRIENSIKHQQGTAA